ncbi:MAG: hypothetical protein Q9224_001545 [Gallowayella concinna]
MGHLDLNFVGSLGSGTPRRQRLFFTDMDLYDKERDYHPYSPILLCKSTQTLTATTQMSIFGRRFCAKPPALA